MKYKNTEKEIIKALVKYEGKAGTIADALTQSNVLERHGARQSDRPHTPN